ncbi:MAG: sugar ABC transporter ATP-binding protein, partial [Rhodocyclaceae bacterium]|nr:sugar ABC transporter ATP-binding protein [Rhodocyclaceae bacterium]
AGLCPAAAPAFITACPAVGRHQSMCERRILLSIREISKHFGGVHALNGVSFDIGEGECHAVVGENGAGKTTLINILSGDIPPDSGRIEIKGISYHRLDPRTSISLGINVIHQELALIGPLSVMENIFVGDLHGKRRLLIKSQRRLKADTRILLDMLGCDVEPTELVERLSTSKKQIVEIAKALSTNPKILIMDEPTSSLTKGETEKLFDIIGSLKAKGISIVFVSHRLNEVMEISDLVTVLRDGRYIGTVRTSESSVDDIVSMMVGRKIELYQKLARRQKENPVFLEVDGFSREPFFRNVSFQARSGEILTFAGLVGAGRTELAESIFGFLPPDGGRVKLFGEYRRIGSPREAMRLGIGLLTEDRKVNGVIGTMVVRENASIAVLPRLMRAGFVRRREENRVVER